MQVAAGTRLGSYEIVSRIGAGGMGEVFKARDTRLDRSVAIKVLPPEFAANAHLNLRFDREAKAISQLNHPHICTLHDVGHESGTSFLVMELLEGESLADRIARGPLPLPDVFRFGAQIAEALDCAHRAGIVHRDLKPGNIMLTKSGAKLLDFGLAKAATIGATPEDATQHKPLTQEGTILGTFQYMAPEQLEGEEADARTDIFALGTVLYEMISGKRAFEGKTRTSLIAAILGGTPKPIHDLQPLAPPALQRLIGKCLEKDPDERWQSAKDIADELRWVASLTTEGLERGRSRWPWLITALALVVAAAAVALWLKRPPAAAVIRLELTAPAEWIFVETLNGPFSVSPDGTAIVFVAAKSAEGEYVLWLRRLSDSASIPLSGTQGARSPFWSPDGNSIGFLAGTFLKRISLSGGEAETICETPVVRFNGGAAWSANDEIVFSSTVGVHVVTARGGTPRLIASSDGKTRYQHPTFSENSEHILITRRIPGSGQSSIVAISLRGGKEQTILNNASNPTYTKGGNLAFVSGDVLFVQPFDSRRLQLRGERSAIAAPVASQLGVSAYSMARAGSTLIYQARGSRATDLLLVDRAGRPTRTEVPTANIADPSISRDGTRAAFAISGGDGTADVWQLDVATGIPLRLSSGGASHSAPIWSPDGRELVLTTNGDLFRMPANGGESKELLNTTSPKFASDWSPDGRFVVFSELHPDSGWDIFAISVADDRIIPVVRTRFDDFAARFSPDGGWITYTSHESGKGEIYVQRFPGGEQKTRVSADGGLMPTWSPDGRELFYITKDELVASEIVRESGMRISGPRRLFDLPTLGTLNPAYAPLPDGKGFLITRRVDTSQSRVANVILNWQALRP